MMTMERTHQQVMQEKLDGYLEQGKGPTERMLRDLADQNAVLHDVLIPQSDLKVMVDGNKPYLNCSLEDQGMNLHNNAIGQIASKLGMPTAWVRKMITGEQWERETIARAMNEHFNCLEDKQVLIRSVDGEARAYLSDHFKRMNNLPVMTGFIGATRKQGAHMYKAALTDLKAHVEVIYPEVFTVGTPNNGEVVLAQGAQLSSSDFGVGSLEVNIFMLQVICNNGMVVQKMIRKIHLGKQMNQDDFAFSDKTIDLNTQAIISSINDVSGTLFLPSVREEMKARITNASEKVVKLEKVVKELPKMGILKDEVSLIEQCLADSDGSTGVTGKLTAWKLSQAVTSVANTMGEERKRELQVIGGHFLN